MEVLVEESLNASISVYADQGLLEITARMTIKM